MGTFQIIFFILAVLDVPGCSSFSHDLASMGSCCYSARFTGIL